MQESKETDRFTLLTHLATSDSLNFIIEKYNNHDDLNINSAKLHFEKVWLTNRNRGWHSGLLPGTVTTNNGLEVTIRIFKSNLNGNLCIVSCPKSNSDTYLEINLIAL